MPKPTKKQLKVAKIYLKAAELLFVWRPYRHVPIYACRAITLAHFKLPNTSANFDLGTQLRARFCAFFMGRHNAYDLWWGPHVDISSYLLIRSCFMENLALKKNQKLLTQRTIALCLMAELAKDGQLDL